jgi:hypothetical protein
MPKQKPTPKNEQDKALSRRNLIIASIVGITVILTFLIELPQKLSATINMFRATEILVLTKTPEPSATFTPTAISNVSTPPVNGIKICQTDFKCRLQNTGHDADQACKDSISVKTLNPVSRIYVEMTEKGSEFGYSIWEVKAFNNNEKLSLKGTATASSSEGLSFDGCRNAQCAVDGEIATRWGSEHKKDSSQIQWLDIILSEPVSVDRIELEWETAYAKNYCITLGYLPTD